MSSSFSDHCQWWSFLLTGALMLMLWAQPTLAVVCDGAAASGADCVHKPAVATRQVPLMLDGRLSDPQALPLAVSSPVLDASLAQLRHEQTALELRMRLLEQQGPAPARPRGGPNIAGEAQTGRGARLDAQRPDTDKMQQHLEEYADGLITLLVAALIASFLLLLIHYRQLRKHRRELQLQQTLPKPVAAVPEWSGDIDFDLKPYIFSDRR